MSHVIHESCRILPRPQKAYGAMSILGVQDHK